MALAWWLNTAWMGMCQPELRSFHRATRRVADTQADVLRAIVRANRESWFGRLHGFDAIADPRAFQRRVPLSNYDDYREGVARIAAGETGVLTREAVTLLEPTSGSSGGEKLIPYTPSLRRQYARGIAAWIGDLWRHHPGVRRGRAYWSISPLQGTARRTTGGVPIGFDDDAAYLGLLQRGLLGRLLVVPSAVSRIGQIEAFRYVTLARLLAADDLAFVSIWNPTFLTSLLAALENWIDPLCRDIRHGSILGAGNLSPPVTQALSAGWRPLPRRAEQLDCIFRGAGSLGDKLAEVWPRLSLISCWTDAAAALSVGELRRLFPHVPLQPKGLLATEGFVSLPLVHAPAPALALRSHFFEFLEGATDGERSLATSRVKLAHELDTGGVYRVVLTTAGGLYRYQLHDTVQVAGFLAGCPLLRFLGKADRTSDLVGEKLHEPHVRTVLERAFRAERIEPRFAMLVPVVAQPARYRLYVQLTDPHSTLDASRLCSLVEAGLAENPHYAYAVSLGQLAGVEIRFLAPAESAWLAYQQALVERGQRPGNVKPAALDAWTGWPDVFRPLQAADASTDDTRDAPQPRPAAAR